MDTETFKKEILRLPEEVRLELAQYAAQQFLDGIEEGKKQAHDGIKENFVSKKDLWKWIDENQYEKMDATYDRALNDLENFIEPEPIKKNI